MLTAIQYAWLYLVENGHAGVGPSYYGGWDFVEGVAERFSNVNRYDYRFHTVVNDAFLADIKKIGVNWHQTKEPTMDSFAQFTDTFHDAEHKDFMQGELVLNDGTKQYWCGEKLETQSVFQMMARVAEANEKFTKIFVTG